MNTDERYEGILSCYRIDRTRLMVALTVLVVLVTATFAGGNLRYAHSSEESIEEQVNSTLADNIENYAGIFSASVTASVNPTGTLAVLAFIGTVEKADIYFPDVEWLKKPQQVLLDIPFIRTACALPIANPTAGVIFTIITIVLYVVRSSAASKLISGPTIDKIEEFGGYVVTVSLSLLPLAVTHTAEAADLTGSLSDGVHTVVSTGTYAILLIISLMSAVFNLIVYIIIHNSFDAIEMIAAAIPIKGMNVIVEIIKALLHLTLVVLQIVSPMICVIMSIIFFIVAVLLFRWLSVVSTYYNYVYLKPLWRKLFKSHEVTPFVHEKFPKRGTRKYPELTMAIPAFSMNKRGKFVKKRELVWMTERDGEVIFLKVKLFRKIKEITLDNLNPLDRKVYLQKTMWFNRILSEDKTVEIIFSSEYNDRWEELMQRLRLEDYQIVLDRLASEDKITMKNWGEKFKRLFKKKNAEA